MTKLALAFFILSIAAGISLAIYASVNSDSTPDPIRDPAPIKAPK